MTDADRITALEATVAELQAVIGDYHNKADMTVRPTELPNGEYPVMWRQRQLGIGIDAVVAKVAALAVAPAQPAPVVQALPITNPAPVSNPVVAGPTIAPLSQSEIAQVNAAMTNGVNAGMPIAAESARIAADLAAGKYSLFDNVLIDAVKLWFYNGASNTDRNALYKWLTIVDQRDPQTNAQLAPSDPRVKHVAGSAVSSAPVPNAPVPSGDIAGIVQQIADTYNVHIAPNVLSVGIAPDAESRAGLQVGGDAEAEVLGISNTRGSDGQNPGEVHKNTLSVAANDGGFRMIQYGNWGVNGLARNTTNRPLTIFALDSMGDICVSDSRIPYGQVFYLVKRANGDVDLCAYQPGAKLSIKESNVYGGVEVQKL